ncbi:transposase [Achromobacter xylosoxidans]
MLKDDLNALPNYGPPATPKSLWQDWYRRAMTSGAGTLCQFARRLRQYLPSILAHARWPLGTNLVAGVNSRVKVIKRMEYGFIYDHFLLTIREVVPGNPRRTKKKATRLGGLSCKEN